MISAFKHIRLSGYNLIPQNVNGNTRLTLNNSGVAYYSELTGVSGYLQELINTANADVSSINGLQNAVSISGRDGIQIFVEGQNIVVSGNDAAVQSLITNLTSNLATTGATLNTKIDNLSGYSNATYATISSQNGLNVTLSQNLLQTSGILNDKIDSLSGYSNSTFATITNLAATGSNLQGQITSLSGNFVTFTGNLATTFATDAELIAASGILSNRIAATGATIQSGLNSLTDYSNNTFATIANLATTGSTLSSRINSLSGYSNSTFATITNLAATGSNLQGQITSLSGAFVTFTGNLAADFATDAELAAASGVLSNRIASTGSTLQSSINSLSGYSNNTFATITNLASTGSTLNSKINSLSGYSNSTFATITNLASTGSTLNTKIDNLSGTLTSDYVQKATQQQFIVDLPTNIESTGITFPVAFASTPNSIQVTFEPSTDVTYMVAVKNRTTAGFTAEFSDVIFEAGNKLNVFASI